MPTIDPTEDHVAAGVLSCMLQDAGVACQAAAEIPLTWFAQERHQILYALLAELASGSGEATPTGDLILLTRELNERKQLSAIGGPGYLADLTNFAPAPAHYPFYKKHLRDHWARRQLKTHGRRLETLSTLTGPDHSTPAVLAEAETLVCALTEDYHLHHGGSEAATFAETVDAFKAEALRRKEQTASGKFTGLATGLPDLDGLIYGLQPGRVYVIGARPKMGKSTLVRQILLHIAKQTPVLFNSLEMSDLQTVEAMLVNIAHGRLKAGSLGSGALTPDDLATVDREADELARRRVLIDHRPANVHQIAASARRARRAHGIGLLVVDYIQRIRPHNDRVDLRQKVAYASNHLADLAVNLGIPILAVAQLNRDAEGELAADLHMGHLKECGDLEQDAAFIGLLGMWNKEALGDEENEVPPRLMGLHVVAHRFGRGGPGNLVKLMFVPDELRFDAVARTA